MALQVLNVKAPADNGRANKILTRSGCVMQYKIQRTPLYIARHNRRPEPLTLGTDANRYSGRIGAPIDRVMPIDNAIADVVLFVAMIVVLFEFQSWLWRRRFRRREPRRGRPR